MLHVFSPEGERALAAVMKLRPLLAFDFDGTLAPIVELPDQAVVPLQVAAALTHLARIYRVAVITGRQAADVPARLGFVPDYIVGNHGAEDGDRTFPASAQAALDALRRRLAAQGDRLASQGVLLEDKQYSLALHYRLASDRGQALRCIDAALADLDPNLLRFGGKLVVNVVGAAAPDKGDAVHRLVERSGAAAAVFVGDDVNDEAVFGAAPPHWLTVRVGRGEEPSQAMFFLHSHAEVVTLLLQMVELSGEVPAGAEGPR